MENTERAEQSQARNNFKKVLERKIYSENMYNIQMSISLTSTKMVQDLDASYFLEHSSRVMMSGIISKELVKPNQVILRGGGGKL